MMTRRVHDGIRMTLLAMLLAATGATAADNHEPVAQMQGDVAWMSGGLGKGARDAMRALGGRYNLKLLFALTKGNFLADVGVRIVDAKDGVVLEAVSGGPCLYANLPGGRYRITGSVNGVNKSVTKQVPATVGATAALYWTPSEIGEPADEPGPDVEEQSGRSGCW